MLDVVRGRPEMERGFAVFLDMRYITHYIYA